jgi:hypothetical protein
MGDDKFGVLGIQGKRAAYNDFAGQIACLS